jgi:hypothetical protein
MFRLRYGGYFSRSPADAPRGVILTSDTKSHVPNALLKLLTQVVEITAEGVPVPDRRRIRGVAPHGRFVRRLCASCLAKDRSARMCKTQAASFASLVSC